MYASNSRARNNVDAKPPTMSTKRSSNSITRTPGPAPVAVPVRTTRSSTPMTAPTQRSKYTDRKATNTQSNTIACRTANGGGSATAANNTNNTSAANNASTTNSTAAQPSKVAADRRKPHSTGSVTSSKRAWNRNNNKESQKTVDANAKLIEKIDPQRFSEVGIQTNEPEIVDYDLLIGDIKFMLPSKVLVHEIDRTRQESRNKVLLKAQRKYEEHSEKQAEHLSDLKEFLEKAVITKKQRKPRETLELDRKLINSMDILLNKEVPKTESITDIKSRIKQKEKELLTLFETVENIQIFSNKNS